MKVLAIDPGREKCGYALLDESRRILGKGIVPTGALAGMLEERLPHWEPSLILLGDGTFSKDVRQKILPFLGRVPLLVVDERDSTYRARRLYFRENPPRGIWKLIPLGLQVPPEPYDDFAAALLGRKYLESRCVS